MKKYLLCIFIVGASVTGLAQELDSLSTDTILVDSVEVVPPKHAYGLYGFFDVSFPPNPEGSGISAAIGVGLKWDRFEGGFIYSQFQGRIERPLIFPNQFNLTYGHGGGFITYSIKPYSRFDLGVMGAFQRGDMIWERLPSGEDFLREKFNLWQVGINLEYIALKYIRPEVTLGYQKMSKIALTGVNESDFTGVFIGFTVKVGYFNQ